MDRRRLVHSAGDAHGSSTTGSEACVRSAALPALEGEDYEDCPGEDAQVEPERPALDVVKVQLDPAVEVIVAPGGDLPQAGDPRLDRQPAPVPERVTGDFAGQWRPRADQTHLALQHVPQLRQLIQARPTQESAGPGEARIFGDLEAGSADFIARAQLGLTGRSVGDHRPELRDREAPACRTDALLAEQDGSAIDEQDHEGDHGKDRPEQHESKAGSNGVDQALGGALDGQLRDPGTKPVGRFQRFVGHRWTPLMVRTRALGQTSSRAALQRTAQGGPMAESLADQLGRLDRAIVEALTYADLFDWPLAPTEIHRYLPIPAGLQEVEAALASSRLRGLISYTDGLFALAGREDLAERRRRRAGLSARLRPRAVRYARLVASLPSVRLVALTGSLAVGAADDDADVDLLVITDDGRLWLSRALTIGVVRLAATRDLQLCPNYFVASSAVELNERDRFTAHELAQLVPICGQAAYRDLLERNAWYREYLPNHPGYTGSILEAGPRPVRSLLGTLVRMPLLDRVERWEMRRKVARLTAIAPGAALRGEARFDATTCKGHFGEHRRHVLERLRERLARLEEAAA